MTKMSAHAVLDHVLKDILHAITPLHEDWVIRFQIIDDLRLVVESMENFRGATVEPFGSFVSNLFTRWGDLDISIELPNGSHISSAGKKRKQMLLGDLQRALKMKGGWSNLQFISHARVPILKFKSNRQGISCDISISNLLGQMKSRLLLWISMIDGRFHDMVLLVKEWAKAHKINNSKIGTLNSYSFSLLVIFHFQTCIPAILPPLKDIYPGNVADDLIGVRADAEKLIEETCHANISKLKSNKSRPINRKSLSELFLEFLEKFHDINTRAAVEGICTYNGQWEQINNNTRWLPKTYAIFIEDPFEQPENSARSVSAGQLTKISEAFKSTHRRLISEQANPNSLLKELAQPHVSQIIRGPPRNTSFNNFGHHHPPRPHMQRAKTRPPQQQIRPHSHFQQHMNQESHTNNNTNSSSTRGNVQAHQRQQQQIWRQKVQEDELRAVGKTVMGTD